MNSEDRDYYAKRERQARASAERSGDTTARRAHLAMAEHYSRMLADMKMPIEHRG